jgi:hypothetical protein
MSSQKAYNKWRHQFPLALDVHGKQIYPGDFLKISIEFEATPFCSEVHWDYLNGAYIQRHPAHKAIDNLTIDEFSVRPLSTILNYQAIHLEEKDKDVLGAFVEKITYSEYFKWYNETKIRYNECLTPRNV